MREGVARTAGAGATDAGTSSWWSRCRFGLPHFEHNLIIDGGAELNHQVTVGNDGKDTQDGSEEDRQPNVGLV